MELEAANKSDMRVHGMCTLELSVHGLLINIDAVVVDLNCQAILGMDILGDATKLPFILDLVVGTLSGGGYETIQLHRFHAATECFAETIDYEYAIEEPPTVQRVNEAPRQSSPLPELPPPNTRPRPASQLPRPRASSVPPSTNPAKRMAVRYHPITEPVTPPITPPRAQAVEKKTVQDTPSPVQKPGRSRGRRTWRAPPKPTPGVGTRSRTRQTQLEQSEETQALAARTEWPPSPDTTKDIQKGFRELRLRDVQRDTHKELQQIVPDLPDLDENQNLPMPPA